jgi:hypothetical protein
MITTEIPEAMAGAQVIMAEVQVAMAGAPAITVEVQVAMAGVQVITAEVPAAMAGSPVTAGVRVTVVHQVTIAAHPTMVLRPLAEIPIIGCQLAAPIPRQRKSNG